MASYESDSSEGEFTETKVLLGYASRDAEDETISKLGGLPDWLDSDKPPSAALARCASCRELMALILQLNAELPEKFPGHDRRLYVFACRRTSCRRKNGSIRAVRGVRVWGDDSDAATRPEAEAAPEQEGTKTKSVVDGGSGPGLGDALFGGNAFGGRGAAPAGANPFSTSRDANSAAGAQDGASNPFTASRLQEKPQGEPMAAGTDSPALSRTFAETLSLNNNNNKPASSSRPLPPHEPWSESAPRSKPYPTLYLAEADYETLDMTPATVPDNAQIEDADAPETVSALDREAFESSMDATFQKFADRLAQNPDQVIRYEFGGTPLLYSKTDAVGERLSRGNSYPGCPSCGGRRTFEVQLTPNAIAELEADDMSLEGMEWGTIIVAVCERDCVPGFVGKDEPAYVEEWAGVQWEELVKQK